MFGLGPATRIYIAVEAIDMRKGFEGLHGLVRDHLGEDPLSVSVRPTQVSFWRRPSAQG